MKHAQRCWAANCSHHFCRVSRTVRISDSDIGLLRILVLSTIIHGNNFIARSQCFQVNRKKWRSHGGTCPPTVVRPNHRKREDPIGKNLGSGDVSPVWSKVAFGVSQKKDQNGANRHVSWAQNIGRQKSFCSQGCVPDPTGLAYSGKFGDLFALGNLTGSGFWHFYGFWVPCQVSTHSASVRLSYQWFNQCLRPGFGGNIYCQFSQRWGGDTKWRH